MMIHPKVEEKKIIFIYLFVNFEIFDFERRVK
jgi:hypothetical protein